MRRGRGARRRRCRDIVDDERRRDRPQPPSAQRVVALRPHLLRCSSSPISRIDSSERLEFVGAAPATNITVFMEVSTKDHDTGQSSAPLAWGRLRGGLGGSKDPHHHHLPHHRAGFILLVGGFPPCAASLFAAQMHSLDSGINLALFLGSNE